MKLTPPSARELFLQASALDSGEARARLLDEACREQSALRQEVEDLLAERDQLGDFLESPALNAGTRSTSSRETTVEAGSGESQHIGPYKLLQEIGEGGCGVVYMAEQESPVRRRVALKVIKLGMDTKNVIARFESERQALAMMDHPNISKVLDAGTTNLGRPYFVMELVRGIPITNYCDQHKLAADDRLRLFMQVSQAIQHAHQKGIIHRDVKPSNILVTLHDGVPVPKIIDFGIAKATEQRLTDKTLFTEFQSFIGTPAYMSPEQAELSGLDIDTRSDIYSLGVLLYELLVGKTPFDAHCLREAGLDACRQTIREVEPERPSQRLSTMIASDQVTTAQSRLSEPAKLIQKLRGDLDWIVMKCLEKDRQRRYATANALVEDVQRYLEGDLVSARPPSTLYRLQKLIARHRVAVTAAVVVVATLAAAATISTFLALRATSAQREASEAREEQSHLRREAERDREKALANAARARLNQYVAEMNLAYQALGDGNFGRAFQLLDKHQLPSDSPDLRGFEWRYLRKLCEGDEHLALPRQGSTVRALAYSPNGESLAVGLREEVHLWDLRTHTRIIQLPAQSWALAFSPDGQTLYTAGLDGVQAWNTSTWISQASTNDRAETMAISPDGSRLLVGTRRRVRLYDTATWEAVWDKPETRSPVAFSHDGQRVITDSRDGLNVSQAADGSHLVAMQDSGRLRSRAVLFSKDDRQVIAPRNVTSSRGSFVLSLWDARTGRELGTLPENAHPTLSHTGGIIALALSPDGNTLASASRDHSIGLWDLVNQAPMAMLHGHRHELWSLAFAPDGQSFATGDREGSLLLWAAEPPRRNHVVRDLGESRGLSPDGSQLASVEDDKALLHIIDLQTQVPIRSLPLAETTSGRPLAVALSGDFTTAVQSRDDGSLQRWHLPTGTSHILTLGDTRAESLRLSHDGRHLITRRYRQTLSHDGRHLITRRYRQPYSWWRLGETAVLVRTLPDDGSVRISHDGSTMVTVSREGLVRVWDLEAERQRHQFRAQAGGRGLALSSDGKILATSGSLFTPDNSIRLWSTTTGEVLGELQGHMQSVASLAFATEGNTLASSSYDSSIKFWHFPTAQELLSIRKVGTTLNHLKFSPDGQWLVGDTGGWFSLTEEMHLFHAPHRH